MSFRIADPWWLLLAAVPVAALLIGRRRAADIGLSSFFLLKGVGGSTWRTRLQWLPAAIRWLAVGLTVVAIGRPQVGEREVVSASAGPARMLVLDVSGSMGTVDEGDTTRLSRMKRAVEEKLEAASAGRYGIVTVSESPRLVFPLTVDRSAVASSVRSLELDRLADRTNLGDAIAVALDHLSRVGATDARIVIYSDGAHNVGTGLSLSEAARVAESFGVPIDVVHAGPEAELFAADVAAMRRVSELTGGRYCVESGWSGLAVAADSEESEATARWYWRDVYGAFLVAAVLALLAEIILRRTVFRFVGS